MTATLPVEVRAAILFGSRARGDSDEGSDTDICIIVQDLDFGRLADLRECCARCFGLPTDHVAMFTRNTVMQMLENGSLFLHHIRDEGRVIVDHDNIFHLIKQHLRPFDGYRHELNLYRLLLEDIDQSAAHVEMLEIDLHVLQLIARNVCILLTYSRGSVSFGRDAAYRDAWKIFGPLPLGPEEYEELTRWHLIYERGGPASPVMPPVSRRIDLALKVRQLVDFAEKSLK